MPDPCHGLSMLRSPSGLTFIRLHIEADETFDSRTEDGRANLKKLRAKFSSEPMYRQEVDIDAHAQSGQLVYSDFDPKIHVVPDSMVPRRLCRYMAIDPHPRTPDAMLWIGVDAYDDIWCYREIWPSVSYGTAMKVKDSDEENRFTIREYAEELTKLEGNELEWRHPEQADEYAIYRRRRNGERILARYMDQAGKGFIASGESQPEESFASRYARFGIDCLDPCKSHQSGEDAIHDLLLPRWHSLYGVWPRIHIAESLKELIFEFMHLRFKSTRRVSDDKELKQDPVEARSHLLDLLRYLATADLDYVDSLAS